ncbi:MAG: hypothetical protein ACO4AZ_10765, partial [Ilumatobacteraceae bacterium]
MEGLRKILKDHAVPDPKIVSKLPKGGRELDYIGHADVTRILLGVDPTWTIEPAAYDDAGLPARVTIGNMVQAGFWMTLLGHTRYCVGSVEDRKSDIGKELLSDAIRNGAMRYGIALSLWTKAEWEDLGAVPTKTLTKPKAAKTEPVRPANPDALEKFVKVCAENNLDHDQVADHAGVDITGIVTTADLVKLRESFKHMKGNT